MKDKFEYIIFDGTKSVDIPGKYDIKMHNAKVELDGVEYTYHSSGLQRCVYISPCRTFVLKIPIKNMYMNPVTEKQQILELWGYNIQSSEHNILEALAYEQCPDDLKTWFAHTEMLQMGWLKQEYVDVYQMSYSHNMREIGIRPSDQQKCLFDYDIIIERELYHRFSESLDEVKFERQIFEKVIDIIKKYG